MNQIQELKQRIQTLITYYTEQKNQATQINQQLFTKLNGLKELELIEKLPPKYLQAYLLFRQAFYSNYQKEHLKQAQFNKEIYLERLAKEIELVEKQLPLTLPTNQQLLISLGERIATGEIKSDANHDYLYLTDGEKGNWKKTMIVDIETGKIKPDPVKELLDKHNINQEIKDYEKN